MFVGTLWFAIFLQLALIIGVVYTLASDSVAMNRLQISVFGAVAIVFAVQGVNQGIFSGAPALDAMSAGWLILAIVDIVWVLYFTAEEDSLCFHVFNLMGTGGLTPPSRRRRTRTQGSIHNMATSNGGAYATNYSSGGGIGSHDMHYSPKMGSGMGSGVGNGGGGIMSQNSFGGASADGGNRSIGAAGSITNVPSTHGGGGPGSIGGGDMNNGPSSPLMAGVAAGTAGSAGSSDPTTAEPAFVQKAKALYTCRCFPTMPDDSILIFCYQTLHRLMIQMKFHSRRVRYWTSWISRANGGRLKRQTVQLEVSVHRSRLS